MEKYKPEDDCFPSSTSTYNPYTPTNSGLNPAADPVPWKYYIKYNPPIIANDPIYISKYYGWSFEDLLKKDTGIFKEASSQVSDMATKTAKTTALISIEEVCKLVEGSTAKDWHKHEAGGGWVYYKAKVSPNASVDPTAIVYDEAVVTDNCYISGSARVFGKAIIGANCTITDKAKVGESACIGKGATIAGSAKIYGTVGAKAYVGGRVLIKSTDIVPDGNIIKVKSSLSRTQKAKGITALVNNGYNVPTSILKKIENLNTEKQIKGLVGRFVRPCPVTPRHGFVDSRPIESIAEAKALVIETKKADPKAEFIIMPFIKACHSGIWTEGQLSIGPGNDGATLGKKSHSIPVQGKPDWIANTKWGDLLRQADIQDSPYIELLWIKDTCSGNYGKESSFTAQFVQLRDGPKIPDSVDYIPSTIQVKHIIRAEGDLLEWESKIRKVKEGTVVYHPGGSLSSHYSVHAFINKIPVLVSKEPQVGETLQPNTTDKETDVQLLRKGFLLGCTASMGYRQACYIMMAGCHSTTKWAGRQDLLLGYAIGCCYRLMMTVCLGEYRHKKRFAGSIDLGRNAIYQEVWNKCLEKEHRETFIKASTSFDKDACWGPSFGGINWYIISVYAMMLWNSLSDGDIKATIEYFNKGVDSVHNGGWTFNKFMNKNEMDITARNPLYAVLQIAPLLYEAVFSKEEAQSFVYKYTIAHKSLQQYIAAKQKQTNKPSKFIKKCCTNDCCGDAECLECHTITAKKEIKHVNDMPCCNKCGITFDKHSQECDSLAPCPKCSDSKNVEHSYYPEHGSYFCLKHLWFGAKSTVTSVKVVA